MASQLPCVKGAAFTTYVPGLVSQANTKLFQVNPTLAAGDVKISIDGGAFANLATLPVVTPAGGRAVKIVLDTSETNGDNLILQFVDAAGSEWCDLGISILTTAQTFDATDAVADGIKTKTDFLPSATAGNAGGLFIAGTNAATTVTTALTTTFTGNLTGSVGSVAGAVGSVTAGVTVTTNNDKTGYGLSAAAVQSIWDALTSALTTVGSIGKWIVDKLDVAVSTRGTGTALDAAGVRTAVGLAAANLDTQLSGIQSDTDNIQTRIPAALSGAGNMKADALAVDGSTTAATNLKQSATVIYVGSVTGAAATTTLIDSALTQADTDHWKGRIVIFLTGSLKYQATDITAFDPATDKLTFTALTNAPAGGDTYVVL